MTGTATTRKRKRPARQAGPVRRDPAVGVGAPVEDQARFTVITARPRRPLGKKFWLTDAGELESTTHAMLTSGTAEVRHSASLEDFAAQLDALETHQVALYGIPEIPRARLVTADRFEELTPDQRQGVITRTRRHIQYPYGPGIWMIDVDLSDAPRGVAEALTSPDKTRGLLLKAVPELAVAPMLWRPSSSSDLYVGDREVRGLHGQRIYVPVRRASDIPTLGALLYERLWLLGYGYITVGRAGQLLDRTPADRSVWQPERIDFVPGPMCTPPLRREPRNARVWNSDAPYFNARSATGLTQEDERAIEAARRSARAAQKDLARERRRAWAEQRGKEVADARSTPQEIAVAAALEAVEHGILRPDFLLYPESSDPVLVRDLLANPDRWHEHRFRDPLDPEYRGDYRIAYANLRPASGRPYLYSHAHGGARYTLSDERPTIRLAPGELPQVVDACSEVIAEEDEIYQLKDQIVRVSDTGRLDPVEPDWLSDWLQRRATFKKWSAKANAWSPSDLPLKYAKTILAKRGELGLPALVGLTRGPLLRLDGSVLDQPGYDPRTQLLYWPDGHEPPRVKREVTPAMAEEALRRLWAPFSKYKFASDVDRGAILALILTAIMRAVLDIAPGGLIESHEAGSGKTLAARALANLTGTPAIPQALAQSEEEVRKSLFAAARGGVPALFFDNIGRDRPLDSSSMAMLLTSGTIADRVLGESTHAVVPAHLMVLFTGNNPRVVGDLNRRIIRARITPGVENPWLQVYDFSPAARTEANWMELRVDGLQLILAMLRDGPPTLARGSGYPDWDRLVRGAVVWASTHLDIGVSFADPVQSLLASYDDDPERDRLRRLLRAWHNAFGSDPHTVKEVLSDSVEPVQADGPIGPDRPDAVDLNEALREIDQYRDSQRVGIYLQQQRGRVVDGLVLEKSEQTRGGSRLWVVRKVGESGEVA